MSDFFGTVADTVAHSGQTSFAEAWFTGGDRVGYDPAHAVSAGWATEMPKLFLDYVGMGDSGTDNIFLVRYFLQPSTFLPS